MRVQAMADVDASVITLADSLGQANHESLRDAVGGGLGGGRV